MSYNQKKRTKAEPQRRVLKKAEVRGLWHRRAKNRRLADIYKVAEECFQGLGQYALVRIKSVGQDDIDATAQEVERLFGRDL